MRVSLTNLWKQFLDDANEAIEDVPEIKFAYVDENGNIRLLFMEKYKNKKTLGIKNMEELISIISSLDGSGEGYGELNPDPEHL